MPNTSLVAVALPVPLRKLFTYSVEESPALIGCRVKVPFGKQTLIGVVVDQPQQADPSLKNLKAVIEVLDQSPVLPQSVWQLLLKTSQYYHHPLGDTLATALPNALLKGEPCQLKPEVHWQVTPQGKAEFDSLSKRAVRLRYAMNQLLQAATPVLEEQLKHQDITPSTLRSLHSKGWIESIEASQSAASYIKGAAKTLKDEQQVAYEMIAQGADQFSPFLLDGITGSGKTELYLQAIAERLDNQKQVLVLIPEIGLTPQTLARFEQRFPNQMGVLHSGLTDRQRLNTWLKARAGILRVIIGTRSAIFTPMPHLGLIIIDEEHDLSFKQQEGLRYSSRDLAILRAQMASIPIILGSATPSLESLNNALKGKYQHLTLSQRATGQQLPPIKLIDCKNQPMSDGFSAPLLSAIEQHLKQGNQVLVFINRRGFAPVLLCHKCGWIADCKRCDSYMTLHQGKVSQYLQCHHCGSYQQNIKHCPKCQSEDLLAVGQGTERIEQFLAAKFPNYPIQRIDRDTTRRKDAMQSYINAAKSGETRLLVGTQMLAKGHHFPKVSLVAVLDIDGALFSSDFRAPERAAQLITQVAGRAGRAEVTGEVLVQTHHPEHSLLQSLTQKSFQQLAKDLLLDRTETELPPVSFMAMFRAESHQKQLALDFLTAVAQQFSIFGQHLQLMGPVASTMSRKSGRYRFQLLINATQRSTLHNALSEKLADIETLPLAQKVRWSLDIDPQDLL